MLRTLYVVTLLASMTSVSLAMEPTVRKTSVRIVADQFWINDKPTYPGRYWNGKKIEGLLLNSRMVQANFDDHAILKADRVHELIQRVRAQNKNGRQLLVGTSYGGGTIPMSNVLSVSDFVLIHGNGVSDPNRIREMVTKTRQVPGYRTMPIVFNEDDHFHFDQPDNNFVAAVETYSSWGYFDFRMKGEGGTDGYQSVPVDWTINSDRKRGFFQLLKTIIGGH